MTTVIHPLYGVPSPSGWEICTIDEVKAKEKHACVAGPFGSNISSKYFVESGVPVIRGINLRDDLTQFVSEGFVFVTEEQAKKYRAQHVRAGDLVFTCWGTIGQVGLIPSDGPFDEYVISNKQLKLRPDPERVDAKFLYYQLASPASVAIIKSRAIGSAVPGINLGILKGLQVCLPPLHVQRRIASILSAYDDLIENNTKRIKVLEEMTRALYREWFVHFRFPGHEEVAFVDSRLGQIPEIWEVGRFDDALVLQRGFDLPTASREIGSVPIYASTGVVGTHNEGRVTGPAIVTGRSGSLGTVRLVEGDFWPLNTALWSKELKRVSAHVAYFLLQELDLARLGGGAAVPTLNRNHVHAMEIIIPDAATVLKFDDLVAPMFKLCSILRQQVDVLVETRCFLLPALISGEIEVDNLTFPTNP